MAGDETAPHERGTAGREMDRQKAYAEAMIRTVREPLVVVDGELRVVAASRSFYSFFGAEPANTLGRLLPDTLGRLLPDTLGRDTLGRGVDATYEDLGAPVRLLWRAAHPAGEISLSVASASWIESLK